MKIRKNATKIEINNTVLEERDMDEKFQRIKTNRKLIKELEKTQANINIEKINFLKRCLEDKDQKNN